jgi:hypothetical protein
MLSLKWHSYACKEMKTQLAEAITYLLTELDKDNRSYEGTNNVTSSRIGFIYMIA